MSSRAWDRAELSWAELLELDGHVKAAVSQEPTAMSAPLGYCFGPAPTQLYVVFIFFLKYKPGIIDPFCDNLSHTGSGLGCNFGIVFCTTCPSNNPNRLIHWPMLPFTCFSPTPWTFSTSMCDPWLSSKHCGYERGGGNSQGNIPVCIAISTTVVHHDWWVNERLWYQSHFQP